MSEEFRDLDDDEYDNGEWIEGAEDDDMRLDEQGCCFPSECLMPGPHFHSECHTVEMMEAQEPKEEDTPRDSPS